MTCATNSEINLVAQANHKTCALISRNIANWPKRPTRADMSQTRTPYGKRFRTSTSRNRISVCQLGSQTTSQNPGGAQGTVSPWRKLSTSSLHSLQVSSSPSAVNSEANDGYRVITDSTPDFVKKGSSGSHDTSSAFWSSGNAKEPSGHTSSSRDSQFPAFFHPNASAKTPPCVTSSTRLAPRFEASSPSQRRNSEQRSRKEARLSHQWPGRCLHHRPSRTPC